MIWTAYEYYSRKATGIYPDRGFMVRDLLAKYAVGDRFILINGAGREYEAFVVTKAVRIVSEYGQDSAVIQNTCVLFDPGDAPCPAFMTGKPWGDYAANRKAQ